MYHWAKPWSGSTAISAWGIVLISFLALTFLSFAEEPKAEKPTIVPIMPRPVDSQPLVLPLEIAAPSVPGQVPAGGEVLSLDYLVEQVLARNPSLAQMMAAWQAASARYPQVRSLDDPMVGGTIGPATIGSPEVNFAYRVEVSQKFPFPHKLRLRGENALFEAQAAGNNVDDIRLRLIEATKAAFFDYCLAEQLLEVNAESLRLLQEFRQNAEARFRTGLVPQQDILQADVEIGREQKAQVTLQRRQQVASARINTLMSLPPDQPLPPSAKLLRAAEPIPASASLRAMALARRPDLQALASRIEAEKIAVALAYKEYCPDFELFFMYDRFMGNTPEMRDLAFMTGVRLNLPVRHKRRQGQIAEAQARLAQRQAELAQLVNDVNWQVQEAYALALEAHRGAAVFEKTILPAAEQNIKAAQAAYTTGKIPFLSLVEAQRNLVQMRERYLETLADYHKARAVLERVSGGP